MPKPISGVVLAGGESRRLGTDKASLTLDGATLLEIVVDRLSAICDDVVVAGGRPVEGRIIPADARFVADAVAGRGPLAGLHAGLGVAKADFSLLVACDMPFLNPDLLTHMANLPRRYQALVPRTADGRWHPAHAVYSRACLPVAEELLAEGNSSMLRLLSRLQVRELSEGEIRRYDPEGLSLFNLNDPKDLERARDIAKRLPRLEHRA